MKIIVILSLIVTVSIAVPQPAQARSYGYGGARSFSSAHFSGPRGGYYGPSRSFSRSGGRYYYYAPHGGGQMAYRNQMYPAANRRLALNRSTTLNPRVYSSSTRSTAARTAALRSQGFDSQGRVLARSSQSWNRNHDHFWHGHRCHFHNNAWVIIDPWFWGGWYPWDYAYYGYGYPYDGYGYYDSGYYYDDGYAPNGYAPNGYADHGYGNGDSTVSQVQAALARKGYYHGAVDGSMGPATRSALRQYQVNHGLEVTGQIDQAVIDKLGVR